MLSKGKLSAAEKAAIVGMYEDGEMTIASLARTFKKTEEVIQKVIDAALYEKGVKEGTIKPMPRRTYDTLTVNFSSRSDTVEPREYSLAIPSRNSLSADNVTELIDAIANFYFPVADDHPGKQLNHEDILSVLA